MDSGPQVVDLTRHRVTAQSTEEARGEGEGGGGEEGPRYGRGQGVDRLLGRRTGIEVHCGPFPPQPIRNPLSLEQRGQAGAVH